MSAAWALLALVAGAAPGDTLTLEQVLASAERHHPLVLASLADARAAEGEATAARGAFDPAVKLRGSATPLGGYANGTVDAVVEAPTPLWGTSLLAGYRAGFGTFPAYDGDRETEPYGELRAGLSVPLLRNGPIDRRRATIERTALGRRLAALAVDQQRLELSRAAAVRYVRWVAAGERLALARGLLELARVRQDQVVERSKRGELPTIEVLDNERAMLQREATVVAAQRAVVETALDLSLFLRRDDGAPRVPAAAELPPRLPTASEEVPAAAMEEVLARRPDVARLQATREQAGVEERLSRNQLWPGLDLQATVSKDLGPVPDSKLHPAELKLMLWFDVPILFRQPLGRLRAAEAQREKADALLRLQRERAEVELADALSALRAAAERARLLARELEVARQLEVAERARFDLGDSTLLFVNLREAGTFESAQRELEARLDYHRAMADFRLAAAQPPR